jgi:hypothetical protein
MNINNFCHNLRKYTRIEANEFLDWDYVPMNDPTFAIALILREYEISFVDGYFVYGKTIECDPDDVLMGFAICSHILKTNKRITFDLFEETLGHLEGCGLNYETLTPLVIPPMFLKTNHNNGQAKLICNAAETALHVIEVFNSEVDSGVRDPTEKIEIIVKGSSSPGDFAGKAYPIMAYILDSAGVPAVIKSYDPFESQVKYSIGNVEMEHSPVCAPSGLGAFAIIDDVWSAGSMSRSNTAKVVNQKSFTVSPREMQPFFLDKQIIEVRIRNYRHTIDYRCGCLFDRENLSCLECSYVEDLLRKLNHVRLKYQHSRLDVSAHGVLGSSNFMGVLRSLIFSYDSFFVNRCGVKMNYYPAIYRMYTRLHKHDFIRRDCEESYKVFDLTHRYVISRVAFLSHPDSFDSKVFSSIQWCASLISLYRHRRKSTVLDKLHVIASTIHDTDVGVMGSATTQGIMSDGYVLVTDDARNIPHADLMGTSKLYGVYCTKVVDAPSFKYVAVQDYGIKVVVMSNYIEFVDDILKFDSILSTVDFDKRSRECGFTRISQLGIKEILFTNGARDRDKEYRLRRSTLGDISDTMEFKKLVKKIISQLNNGDAMARMLMSQIALVAESVLD